MGPPPAMRTSYGRQPWNFAWVLLISICLLRLAPMVLLGRLSLAIYLVHMPVYYFLKGPPLPDEELTWYRVGDHEEAWEDDGSSPLYSALLSLLLSVPLTWGAEAVRKRCSSGTRTAVSNVV